MSKMGTAPPPGEEAKFQKFEEQVENELLGFMKNEFSPDFSRYKGRSYI
jgi:hypothetical protein